MKKSLFLVMMVSLLGFLAACGDDEPDLVVTSFTDELQEPIEYFEELHDVNVDLQIIPTENYVNTLRPALESGSGAPDVFTGEIVYLKDWVNQDYWEDLSQDPYNVDEWSDDYMEYVWDLGRDEEGSMRALSWQTTPGGIYYRRSIAEEVLGTDDPDEIGEMFDTVEGLLEVGEMMKEHDYRLFPDEGSIAPYTNGANPQPWVNENDELIMTDERMTYFDYAKTLRDEQYTALAPAWSPAWFASFTGPISYNVGWDELDEDEEQTDETEVFAVSLPTWGLHSVLEVEAQETAGDWAVTNGPTPYFEGGTWIGMYKDSENHELAFEFIQMLVNDEEFLTEWVSETGDVLSYYPVMDEIGEDYSNDFLGGQNHYDFFMERAEEIDASHVTAYDQTIEELFGTQVGAYVEGDATQEEALAEFYSRVTNAYPDLVIPDELEEEVADELEEFEESGDLEEEPVE
ncbi:ABC-type glycerol-3-phosphate transport system, substrate-binding protein [Pelagirhabdus alkalitolerans]|uniref:ABC-type glycerol-3-phosphate transport system, substrate-binding protein n=1 Tax=Pelagirhabdus alkalitolerans TaxID=1612202 RepID=A0A1G6K014_9BACI|nr:ABC transporter substrate-binding protein [Pelagirhabdus alkalitolerans]SDC24218.1 ABC-type glycerol-3-phosphate transport system, substrate-binding protein [Pelagirhabdus alkalitolerans]